MLDDDRIRKTLLKNGLASVDTIRELELLAVRRGTSLYRACIETGRVSEDQLVGHLAARLGVPSVSLAKFTAKESLLELLEPTTVSTHRALPVGLKERDGELTLFVAMDDPHDLDALEVLGQASRYPIVPLLAGPCDLDAAIQRVYPGLSVTGPSVSRPPLAAAASSLKHDIFANVLDDLPAQSADMLSALSMLDDIPRNRHEQVTSPTGFDPIADDPRMSAPGDASDGSRARLEPPPSEKRPDRTGFGKPASSVSQRPGFARAKTKPSLAPSAWKSRSSEELVRALVSVLLERGVITEKELERALGE